jgi:hypothetical protein
VGFKPIVVAMLFVLTGCGYKVDQSTSGPTSIKPIVITAMPTEVPRESSLSFAGRIEQVQKRSPVLAKFIMSLYRNSAKTDKTSYRKLKNYIRNAHNKGHSYILTNERAYQYAYGATEYSKHFGINKDIFVSLITHENGWHNTVGDTSRRGQKVLRYKWSWGLGQIQYRTADGFLSKNGINGLVEQDLLDFPLLNLYVAGGVLAEKVIHYKDYSIALQSYNGGQNGWKDGRSKGYKNKVLKIYASRNKWNHVVNK